MSTENAPGQLPDKVNTGSRIIVILPSLRAEGTPRMTLDLCRLWKEQGVQVVLLDLQRGPAELGDDFAALGVTVHSHPVASRGYLRYPGLAWATYKLCRLHRPNVVLSMLFGLHSFIAIGARLAGVSRVCAHAGNPPTPDAMPASALRKFRHIVAIGRQSTYRIICCSQVVQSAVVRYLNVPQAMTTVIYNGCSLADFSHANAKSQSDISRPDKVWVLGMVATLEGHKDQATLIQATALLAARGAKLELRLIGEGARRAKLEKLAESLSAPVQFLGSRNDIPLQLAGLDIFVFATTEQEGLGIALIEAMAAGLPIIASNVAACREVLGDTGECGELVPPGDAEALAAALSGIMRSWPVAQKKTSAARQRAERIFSAQAMSTQYLNALGVDPTNPI